MRRSFALLSLLALASVACGSGSGDRAVLDDSASAISGGTTDSADKNVVGMYINSVSAECTGSLIAPNLVLTAHHCVAQITETPNGVQCGQSPFGSVYAANQMYFTTATVIDPSQQFYRGAEVYVPPGGNDTCGFDVALVRLSQNVPASTTKPLVPRIDYEVTTDELYTAVGFGNTNDYSGAGTRRKRTKLKVQCPGTFCFSPQIAASEWLGETGICSGDSGGPALDAQGRVIGVTSRGSAGCTSPVYGAMTSWKDWLMATANDAATKGGYKAPNWALTGSSDPVGSGGAGGSGGSGGTGGIATGGTGGTGGSSATGGTGGVAGAATGGSGGTSSGGTAGGTSSGGTGGSGGQGFGCTGTGDCAAGFQCVEDGTGAPPYCTARCDGSTPCPTSFDCQYADPASPTAGVCLPSATVPQGVNPVATSDQSSGCAIVASGPVQPVPWVTGLALVGVSVMRRRRRLDRGVGNGRGGAKLASTPWEPCRSTKPSRL